MDFKYQIFDSMDRPCSPKMEHEADLHQDLMVLQLEAAEENTGYTYAIAKVYDDGTVTYDY